MTSRVVNLCFDESRYDRDAILISESVETWGCVCLCWGIGVIVACGIVGLGDGGVYFFVVVLTRFFCIEADVTFNCLAGGDLNLFDAARGCFPGGLPGDTDFDRRDLYWKDFIKDTVQYLNYKV